MTQHSLLHNSWILVGLFLLSGGHGGFAQKNRVSPYFHSEGPVAPEKKRSYTIGFTVSQSFHSDKRGL